MSAVGVFFVGNDIHVDPATQYCPVPLPPPRSRGGGVVGDRLAYVGASPYAILYRPFGAYIRSNNNILIPIHYEFS